jgi:histidinol-phosphate aminotransferase
MTSLADLPIRDELRGRSAYRSPQEAAPVRLNNNENTWPLPDEVVGDMAKAIEGVLRELNRYPDRDAMALREALAGYLGEGLTWANVWVANGSNEVLQQLMQTFGGSGRLALGFTPSYSMHPVIAASTGTAWVNGQRTGDFGLRAADAAAQVRAHRPDVVLLCSPNNPTGTPLDADVIPAVLAEAPGMVIIDEAYAEFARAGARGCLDLLASHPRLVVTRTMSKAFALAGVRLGVLAADAAVVEAVQLVRLPYHLSSLTQAAALAALAHAPALLATVEAIKVERDRLAAAMAGIGLRVVDSDANFVLFGVASGAAAGRVDQAAVWRALRERGVLVRDVGLAGWLRVTAGTPAENDAFLAALGEAIAEVDR